MSEYETHIGKIKKVDLSNISIEDFCKAACNDRNITKLESYYDSWQECFMDRCDREYVIVNDSIYKIISDKNCSDDDIFEAHENYEGQIEYCLSYYNGGCSFSEAIETALERMEDGD